MRIIKYIGILLLLFVAFILIVDSNMRPTRLGKTEYYLMSDPMTLSLFHRDKNGNRAYGYLGIATGRLTDVYWDEQYILATQCSPWNDSILGYYIVKMLPPVKKGVPWRKIGPLSKEEYKQKKQELRLEEKDMRHINLFDRKHVIFGWLKIIAIVSIWAAIVWCIVRWSRRKGAIKEKL